MGVAVKNFGGLMATRWFLGMAESAFFPLVCSKDDRVDLSGCSETTSPSLFYPGSILLTPCPPGHILPDNLLPTR